jgi:PAT family beta-lactamase induction signal transducer AmpG
MIKSNMGSSLFKELFSIYMNRSMLAILFLGFCGGLPYLLYSSTLAYWMAQEGVNIKTIGLFALATFPAAFKFLWAPFMGVIAIPWLSKKLGMRRSWLLLSQIVSSSALCAMSFCDPSGGDLTILAVCSVVLSIGAASQNVMILTYQVERLGRTQYGAGEATCVFGYRMGLLLAGAGALYMSTYIDWQTIYLIMTIVSMFGIITCIVIDEPSKIERNQMVVGDNFHQKVAAWFYEAVLCPFKAFAKNRLWFLSLMIMLLYKIGDHLSGRMVNIFYKEMGFSAADIANASKVFAMWSSIVGGVIGGYILSKISIYRSLLLFGAIHGLTFMLYVLISWSSVWGVDTNNLFFLYMASGCEHFTSGMALTALFSYQMLLSNKAYATTQLALFTSFANMGRSIFAAPAGYLVENLGWSMFFMLAAILSVVILPVIYYVGTVKERYD